MKTLLIPVDFTATTDNAVNFGAEWCNRYEYQRIILLKTFYSNVFDHIVVSAEYAPVSHDYMLKEREETKERLEAMAAVLTSKVGADVSVVMALSEEPLLRSVMEIIESESPELVLLGSNNYSASNDSLISDNVIAIAKISPVRVLIVPVNYSYKPVHTALVPVIFNTLESLDKLNSLRVSPLWAKTNLIVLNVDPKKRYLNPGDLFIENEKKLHEYLKNFSHTIQYTDERHVVDGVLHYTRSNDIDLIIAMPGKHSFLYNLTHSSISEAIYLNAREPVLILK